MAAYTNISGGSRVLPSGREVPNGGSVEIGADEAKHPAVANWIDRGDLLDVRAHAKATQDDAKATAAEVKQD